MVSLLDHDDALSFHHNKLCILKMNGECTKPVDDIHEFCKQLRECCSQFQSYISDIMLNDEICGTTVSVKRQPNDNSYKNLNKIIAGWESDMVWSAILDSCGDDISQMIHKCKTIVHQPETENNIYDIFKATLVLTCIAAHHRQHNQFIHSIPIAIVCLGKAALIDRSIETEPTSIELIDLEKLVTNWQAKLDALKNR